jgi:hypothetical protein
MALILAILGALLVACGAGLWNVPAGLVTAGLECLAAAYVASYLKARAR